MHPNKGFIIPQLATFCILLFLNATTAKSCESQSKTKKHKCWIVLFLSTFSAPKYFSASLVISINSYYWKLLRKYYRIVTHTLFHCSSVYTIILSTLLLLHHWYCYCHLIVQIIEITWILIDLNNNVEDNLHLNWENWWRRHHLYFGWTYDAVCAAEIRFHCRVPGDDWHPICSLFHSVTVSIVL